MDKFNINIKTINILTNLQRKQLSPVNLQSPNGTCQVCWAVNLTVFKKKKNTMHSSTNIPTKFPTVCEACATKNSMKT